MDTGNSQQVGGRRPPPNYVALRTMGVKDFEGSSDPNVVDVWLLKLTRTLDEVCIDNHEDRIAMAVHVLHVGLGILTKLYNKLRFRSP
ncbi:unnamed protein product [Linum trigynum]|uniref:Uncharacterized protein n=1 Tax=Linum trigynum TaxID=586398 RepID=A0AAV2G9K4_9ROSI